eukprot:scaffold9874_cov51-Cyclotella_meneghiniana.AAC.7
MNENDLLPKYKKELQANLRQFNSIFDTSYSEEQDTTAVVYGCVVNVCDLDGNQLEKHDQPSTFNVYYLIMPCYKVNIQFLGLGDTIALCPYVDGEDDASDARDEKDEDEDSKVSAFVWIKGAFDFERQWLSLIRLANECGLLSSVGGSFYQLIENELGRSVDRTKEIHSEAYIIGNDFPLRKSSAISESEITKVQMIWEFYLTNLRNAKKTDTKAIVIQTGQCDWLQLYADPEKNCLSVWSKQEQYDVLRSYSEHKLSYNELKRIYNINASDSNSLLNLNMMNGNYFNECSDDRSIDLNVILKMLEGGEGSENQGVSAMPTRNVRSKEGWLVCDDCGLTSTSSQNHK